MREGALSQLFQPRFRLRASGGPDLLLPSVEALAERVEQGAVSPETLMFDSGTGLWSRAGESPVVCFIVEELARDGRAPEAFRSSVESGIPDPSPAVAHPKGDGGAAPEIADTPGPGRPERPPIPRFDTDEWFPVEADRRTRALHEPGATEEARRHLGEPPVPGRPGPTSGGAARSPERSGRARSAVRPLFLVAALSMSLYLLLDDLMGARPFPGATTDDGAAPAAPSPPTGPTPLLTGVTEEEAALLGAPRVPDGLEPQAEAIRRAVDLRFRTEVDSLRTTLDLPASSPRIWLAGEYLASAHLFPGVRDFWVGYGELVEHLSRRDQSLYATTVRDALQDDDSPEAGRLEAYFRDRYQALRPRRQDRYAQLSIAAERAVALHDFLTENTDSIRHTPALGGSLPVNPVLEAEAAHAGLQRELEMYLDRVLEALDRSTGPGAPPAAGLTVDLFRRFGDG